MDKRRVNVRSIIYKNGKILAVKHRNSEGEANYWCVPGGGLDPLESLLDGVKREIMEETGIEARVGKLLFIQQFVSSRHGREEELEFFFNIENVDDFETIDLSKTSHGLEEIAQIAFIDPKVERVLPSFLRTGRGRRHR
jgi:ADP-ribose pyrophosphatase YjhB (NUDIX family)